MKHRILLIMTLLATTLLLLACTVPAPGEPAQAEAESELPESVTLVTHDSFDISAEVLQQFEDDTGIRVEILKSGDAGEMLNTMILSKENPLGDVAYGIDNTFMSRALEADLFTPYEAPGLATIPDDLKLDPTNRLLPVDFGFVTLNYDIAWFEEQGLDSPDDIEDLIDPAYQSLAIVQNPASSSPGLSFLLTTVGRFGTEGPATYLTYWEKLRANDVLVTDGWSEAYWGEFTVGSGGEGDRPIVVSYATSPVAEVYYNELDEAPTRSVNTPGNSFRQVEFVGILAKSEKQEAARMLVDFLLGKTFQEDIPLHMFVYPANTEADMGDLFRDWADVPTDPVQLDPATIAENRDHWIKAWTDVMLR